MVKPFVGFRSTAAGWATACVLLATVPGIAGTKDKEDFELPKEVTPAVRAACEGDVRRFCVHKGATADSVKVCVFLNFNSFNQRCQTVAIKAGLKP